MPVCITKLEGTAFLAFPECKNLLTSELSRRFNYGKILSAATISGSAFASQNCQWFGDLLYCPNFCVDSGRKLNLQKTEIFRIGRALP